MKYIVISLSLIIFGSKPLREDVKNMTITVLSFFVPLTGFGVLEHESPRPKGQAHQGLSKLDHNFQRIWRKCEKLTHAKTNERGRTDEEGLVKLI